jgi:uncharacterized coiled-coil DUF342 family protein
MDYLREFIEDSDEAIEFWDSVCCEIEEMKDEIKEYKEEIEELEEKVEEIEEELDQLRTDKVLLNTINCGIGVINYEQPENMQLQTIMEEFKEEIEGKFKAQ